MPAAAERGRSDCARRSSETTEVIGSELASADHTDARNAAVRRFGLVDQTEARKLPRPAPASDRARPMEARPGAYGRSTTTVISKP
jgi:hypothetical protein